MRRPPKPAASVFGGRDREQELAARVVDADKHAFAEIYDHAAAVVYRTAFAATQDAAAAESITQDVFLAVWRYPARLLAAAAKAGGIVGHLLLEAFRRVTAWHDLNGTHS